MRSLCNGLYSSDTEHASSLSHNGKERSNEKLDTVDLKLPVRDHTSDFLCHFVSCLESPMPGV